MVSYQKSWVHNIFASSRQDMVGGVTKKTKTPYFQAIKKWSHFGEIYPTFSSSSSVCKKLEVSIDDARLG